MFLYTLKVQDSVLSWTETEIPLWPPFPPLRFEEYLPSFVWSRASETLEALCSRYRFAKWSNTYNSIGSLRGKIHNSHLFPDMRIISLSKQKREGN